MYRTNCCVCEGIITKIKTMKDYPLTYYPKDTPDDTRNDDCDIGICTYCNTIQLMDLIDPNILYGDFHNNTSFSKKWQDHHDSFYKFIKDKLHGKCIEIGGKSGEIVKRLENLDNYYTLDFANPTDDPKNLNGNCEEFDFTGYNCVIMSHVFEHLYNPIKFAENMCKGNIDDVFISIPNMKNNIGYLNIHREHTYLCTESTVIRLFPKYSCTIEYFENHSIFIHLFKTKCISQNILSYYDTMEKTVINNEYIFPAGMQGTHIYYLTKSNHIKGFVDNDPMKQGKYLNGKPIISPIGVSNIYYGHSIYINDTLITN